MAIAAFWGTTVGYSEYWNRIVLETIDNRIAVISQETFDYLFNKLDSYNAALKEDCIEYTINDPDMWILEHPDWFIDAMIDGSIYTNEGGTWMFHSEDGEIAMSSNSVILRNYKGELMYLEGYKFHQYYDTLEE